MADRGRVSPHTATTTQALADERATWEEPSGRICGCRVASRQSVWDSGKLSLAVHKPAYLLLLL